MLLFPFVLYTLCMAYTHETSGEYIILSSHLSFIFYLIPFYRIYVFDILYGLRHFLSQSNSYKLFISYIFISLLYIFLFSFLFRQSVKINTPLSSAYVLYLACPEIFGEGDRFPLRTGFCNVRFC